VRRALPLGRLEVLDRGTPIAPEQVEALFGGSGASRGSRRAPRLELDLGRRVAESLGGRAGARSAPGETVLWLELPAAPGAAGERRAQGGPS
jgi:signal transduction histidine kinase